MRVPVVLLIVALGATGAAASCASPEDVVAPLAGGATTVVDRTSGAYGFPAPNLTEEDLARHRAGEAAFEATFVSAPATINPGLGPLFSNAGCTRCHVEDGRGLPVAGPGPLGSPLVVRVSLVAGEASVPGGPVPVAGLGTQLQDHAIYGAVPEARLGIRWIEQPGAYGDGEPFSLRRPALQVTLVGGEPLPGNVLTSARVPPPVFGLGLLEAVPEGDILALADPEDRDGDGISGRANQVWDALRSEAALGRFGWKASTPALLQQAGEAYANDMGVSSPLFPEADGTRDIDGATVEGAAFYTQTLSVPGRDSWDAPVVVRGEALFRTVGCTACHVEELRTGDHPIAALREQTIHAYTDLLLHNMGFDLADGRPDFLASGTEWRTAPLWGLGLAGTVLPGATFLHDGRARTLAEAILWHGGEAETSKERFRTLTAGERAALLAFLESL